MEAGAWIPSRTRKCPDERKTSSIVLIAIFTHQKTIVRYNRGFWRQLDRFIKDGIIGGELKNAVNGLGPRRKMSPEPKMPTGWSGNNNNLCNGPHHGTVPEKPWKKK